MNCAKFCSRQKPASTSERLISPLSSLEDRSFEQMAKKDRKALGSGFLVRYNLLHLDHTWRLGRSTVILKTFLSFYNCRAFVLCYKPQPLSNHPSHRRVCSNQVILSLNSYIGAVILRVEETRDREKCLHYYNKIYYILYTLFIMQ